MQSQLPLGNSYPALYSHYYVSVAIDYIGINCIANETDEA